MIRNAKRIAAVGAVLTLGFASAAQASIGSGGGSGATTSNTLVSVSVSPIASVQTTSILAGNITGSLGGGFGGGGFGGGAGPISAAPGPQTSLIDNVQSTGIAGGQSVLFDLRALKQQQGGSAGSKPMNMNAWLRGAYTSITNTDRGGEFEGGATNVVGGVDYLFQNTKIPVLVGLSGGYENTDIDTTFNTGTFEGNGFTLAPYIGLRLLPNLLIDMNVGMSWIDYDVSRTVGGSKRTGSFDATRLFYGANATYNHFANNWRLSPTVGIIHMREEQDGYTENNGTAVLGSAIDLTRAKAGVEVGYNLGGVNKTLTGIEPFVKMIGEYDIESEDGVDLGNGVTSSDEKYGAVAGGGVNLKLGEMVSGTLDGSYNSIG
ncbi:MAG: autotransporter outer membrane beta-barrel domain-containing protein, partial [Alphaproteobacteria bacterium]